MLTLTITDGYIDSVYPLLARMLQLSTTMQLEILKGTSDWRAARRSERHPVSWLAMVVHESGLSLRSIVGDASPNGIGVRCNKTVPDHVKPGTALELYVLVDNLPHHQAARGVVRWVRGNRLGIQFA
jgi:hypothetical protein